LILEKGGGEKAKKRGFPRDSFITWELVVVETGEERRGDPRGEGGIPCVTEHPGLGAFPISDIAKRFYISARIQTNLKDNFTNLSAV
jgi:hypothetical protein